MENLLKTILKKKQVSNEQSPLEKKVQDAINHIAEVLNIPDIRSMKLPRIISTPEIGFSGYNLETETVNFDSEDLLDIYEEAGHIIHLNINPYLKQLHLYEEPKLADGFFTLVLGEAFAYFCSRLSEESRDENHMEIWRESLAPRSIEYEIYNTGYEMYKIALTEENTETPEINKKIDKLLKKVELLWKVKLAYGDPYDFLFHSMGYDLGADLYKHYKKSPDESVSMVNKILYSLPQTHRKLFFDAYRELHEDLKNEKKKS